jgi:hypothetical protein
MTMDIFNARQLLRHTRKDRLQNFIAGQPYADYFRVLDWALEGDQFSAALTAAIEEPAADPSQTAEELLRREDAVAGLHYDLKRVYALANDAGIRAFHNACNDDAAVQDAFDDLTEQEKSLWMLTHRPDAFHAAELELVFSKKVQGKFWKRHRIIQQGQVTRDRNELEAFAGAVGRLYKKLGAGQQTEVLRSDRFLDGHVQITIYVIGPKTAQPQFTATGFDATVITRLTLDTAILYDPLTGLVETVVRGGAANHKKVLALFGDMILKEKFDPEEITAERYDLAALQNGIDPFVPLHTLGIDKVRLRRARFEPKTTPGTSYLVEASAEMGDPDAIDLAKSGLRIHNSLETDYSLVATTLLVYRSSPERNFSFDCTCWGSSTIKNLASTKSQKLANALLEALQVSATEATDVGETAGD